MRGYNSERCIRTATSTGRNMHIRTGMGMVTRMGTIIRTGREGMRGTRIRRCRREYWRGRWPRPLDWS